MHINRNRFLLKKKEACVSWYKLRYEAIDMLTNAHLKCDMYTNPFPKLPYCMRNMRLVYFPEATESSPRAVINMTRDNAERSF